MKKDSCLTEGTSYAGCQHKAARHVPSPTSEVQRSYIITTVQLNSIKFSLGECRRHIFKTRYISLEVLASSKLLEPWAHGQASVPWPPSPRTPAGWPGTAAPCHLNSSDDHWMIGRSCHSPGSVQVWVKAFCPRRHSSARMGSPPQLAPSWGSPALPAPWHKCAAFR